ncbi:transposase [Streptomyces sp. NPDC057963]|uniref:transposase n=1 Tax=Streptomyces sp. NPDC057963 TaxID=3346290 RepID=UPI0036E3EB77
MVGLVRGILDNYATHKTPAIKQRLVAHPRCQLLLTPAGSSWLNLVERWFGELTQKKIRRGVHRSAQALERDIRTRLADRNDNPRPFVWTKTADEIPDRVAVYCRRISDSGNRLSAECERLRRRSDAVTHIVSPTRERSNAPPTTMGTAAARAKDSRSSAHVGSSPIVLPPCTIDVTTPAEIDRFQKLARETRTMPVSRSAAPRPVHQFGILGNDLVKPSR